MKKVYAIICFLIMFCSFSIFVACGETNSNVELIFEKQAYEISWEDGADNSLTIFATSSSRQYVDYNLYYKNSDLKIEGEYLADGRYSFTIFPNQKFSSSIITFKVNGGLSSTVTISCVSTLRQINLKSLASITYAGSEKYYDLSSLLLTNESFVPNDTLQTNVQFEIDDILKNGVSVKNAYQESIYIDKNNNLVAKGGVDISSLPLAIKIKAKSLDREDVVSSASTVNFIQAILPSDFTVKVNSSNLENKTYDFAIADGTVEGGLEIEAIYKNPAPHNISLDIVFKNGIFEVKTATETRDNAGHLTSKKFVLVPSPNYNGNGSDEISFKILYNDFGEELIFNPVKVANEWKPINVTSSVQIDSIKMFALGNLVENGYVDLYTNSDETEIYFSAYPTNTNQRTLKFVASKGFFDNFVVSRSNSLLDADKIITPKINGNEYYFEVSSDELLYVKLKDGVTIQDGTEFTALISSSEKTSVSSNYTFRANIGANSVLIVEKVDTDNGNNENNEEYKFKEIQNPVIYLENGEDDTTNTKQVFVFIEPVGVNVEKSVTISCDNVDIVESFKLFSENAKENGGAERIGNIYIFTVKSKSGYTGEDILTIKTANGKTRTIKIVTFAKIKDVTIKTATNPELSNAIGDYSYNENTEIEYLAIKKFSTLGLEYLPDTNSEITETKIYYFEMPLSDKSPYDEDYLNFGKDNGIYSLQEKFGDSTLSSSQVVNSQNLAMSKVLSGENEGKTIIKFEFYGNQIGDDGVYKTGIVATKYILVEVYTPITSLSVSDTFVDLYAREDLYSGQYDLSEKTITISLNSDATYKKFIIGGEEITADSPKIDTNYKIELVGDNEYKITLLKAYETLPGGQTRLFDYVINIVAMDLKDINIANINDSNAKYVYRQKITLTAKSAVKVSGVSLNNVPVENGAYTIYLDLKNNNTFNILANILPENALNKNLEYIYQPNTQKDQNIITVNNGIVKVNGSKGGQGKIIIVPQDRIIVDEATGIKTIRFDTDSEGNLVLGDWYNEVNVIVADGLSRDTAIRINSLDQINNADLHYVLLASSNLDGKYILSDTFNGGLYGRISKEGPISTITTNHTLFDQLGPNAKIFELNIVGSSEILGSAVIANVNDGQIADITVTNSTKSVLVSNELKSITVATTLKVDNGYLFNGKNYAGGLVAVNNGTILNSIFAGAIKIIDNSALVGALVGYNANNAKIDENTYVHIYNLRTGYGTNGIASYSKNDVRTTAGENPVNKTLTFDIDESITYTIISNNENANINNTFIKTYVDDDVKVSQTDLDNIYFKKSSNSLNNENNKDYAVLMYYETDTAYSLSAMENMALARKNMISISDLLQCDDNLIDKIQLRSGNINLFNALGSTAYFYGKGEFKLEITSKFDESITKEIKVIIINYSKELVITNKGYELGNNATIYTRDNTSVRLQSSADTFETLYNRQIKFKTENFLVEFTPEDSIVGNNLGLHLISVSFEDKTSIKYSAKLNLYSERIKSLQEGELKTDLTNFDAIISNEFKKDFSIEKIFGATGLRIVKTDIKIEPKDTIVVSATLITDIDEENLKVQILSQDRQTDYTDCFAFLHDTTFTNNNVMSGERLSNGERKFDIKFMLNDESKSLKGKFITYITVDSKDFDTGVSAEFDLTITPQKISNINSTLYNVEVINGKYSLKEQTSVLSTNDSNNTGMLMVNLYPNYADYDYLRITSSSDTSNYPLSLRLYKKTGGTFEPAKDNEFVFIDNGSGLVVYKQNNENSINVGIYYIKIYVNANVTENTIYNINITPYLNNEPLDISSIFTLYIKPQQKAGITFNGEDHIYTTKGSEITANVMITSDQELVSTTFLSLDGKTLDKYVATILEQTEDTTKNVYGYKYYNIKIKINERVLDNDIATQSFRVGITTKRVLNGIETYITSYASVYVMDFMLDANATFIDAINGNTQYINNLVSQKLTFNFGGTGNVELLNRFNNDYYYYYNNEYIINYIQGYQEDDYKQLGIYGLIKNIYYQTSENTRTPIYNDIINRFVENEYLDFSIRNNELYVLGKQSGTVDLVYYMPMVYPDGSTYYFEYKFTLVVRPYTDYDKPTVISSNSDFLDIFNKDNEDNYILMQDLYLYDFSPIENTEKITSLDGNNKTINIISFNNQALAQTNIELALFKTISENTTITNLTVNIFELGTITPTATNLTSIKIAGLALTNNGVVYNTEVVSYKSRSAVGYNGISLVGDFDKDIDIQIAGFVLNNSTSGSITNSRVGGDQRKVINVIKDANVETNVSYSTKTIQFSPFNISGYGDIAGFVYQNSGTISSSFVKNVKIENKSVLDNDFKNVTSGFVYQNDNTILLSYVEGVRTSSTETHISKYGISTAGIATGFVYVNNGDIKDCYSNIKLTNDNEVSGRFSAGFVYKNNENALIKNAYSFSLIKNNSATQTNFTGVDTWGNSQNFGTLSSCYYYSQSATQNESQALEEFYNTDVTALDEFNQEEYYYGFAFDGNGEPTWEMTITGPKIVSADKIAISVRYEINYGEDTVFMYADGYRLGSECNPIIIKNAKEFNEAFGTSLRDPIINNLNLTKNEAYGSYRLVGNISLSDLLSAQGITEEDNSLYSLSSTTMTLTGEKYDSKSGMGYAMLDGNGLTISGLALSDKSFTTKSTENFGLFKEIKSGAVVKNLNIVVGVQRRSSESSETIYSGIDAKNANIVGALAGTMADASAINITVSGVSTNADVTVLGKNIVGAVFGRVIGTSTLTNITAQNINVTASYNSSVNDKISQINRYTRADNVKINSGISIAGGVVGVYDHYETSEKNVDLYSTSLHKVTNPTAITIKTTGVSQIYGGTAGGVFGYVGHQSFVQDALYEIPKNTGSVNKIIAKSAFAGGVVGFNRGYLRMARAEHEQSWQKEIEENISSYYHASSEEVRNSVDRGQLDLFEDDVYTPTAVGGIVGLSSVGKIEKSYSKVNVISKSAKYAGGVVGYYAQENYYDELPTASSGILAFEEVYSFSDVYANEYIGGIIGYADSSSVSFKKVNAVNYWAVREYTENTSLVVNVENSVEIAVNASDNVYTFITNGGEYKVGNIDSTEIKISKTGLRFADSNTKAPSLADMQDVTATGAEFDRIFRLKDWTTEHWNRDEDELLPHLVFGFRKGYYIIEDVNDLPKLEKYGKDSRAKFVIVGKGNNKMIDASGFNYTISSFQGELVGKDGSMEYGIKNLNQPLFDQVTGAKFSDFKLENCANFIQRATNVTVFNLSISNSSTITKLVAGSALIKTLSGKSNTINGVSINNITVHNEDNLGLLVAKIDSGTEANIENVNVQNSSVRLSKSTKNAGLLIGKTEGTITLSNIYVSGSVSQENVDREVGNSESETTLNLGGVVGISSSNPLTLNNINSDCYMNINVAYGNVNIANVIGSAQKVEISGNIFVKNKQVSTRNATQDSNLKIKATEANIGTVFGYAEDLTVTADILTNANMNIDATTLNSSSSALNFGGFAGKYLANSEKSISNSIITLGNYAITLNNNETSAKIGGVLGNVVTNGEGKHNFNNLIYAGSTTVGGSCNELSIGGLIGDLAKGSTVSNSITYGDIEFLKGESKQKDLHVNKVYAGGLVGKSNGAEYSKCLSLTTIINKNAENIVDNYDGVKNTSYYNVNALIGNSAVKTNENSKGDELTNTFYSHVINLCSDANYSENYNIKYSEICKKAMAFEFAGGTTNLEGATNSIGDKLAQFVSSNMLTQTDIQRFYEEGSKINPIAKNNGELTDIKNNNDYRQYYYLNENYYVLGSIDLENTAVIGDGANIRVFNYDGHKDQIPFNSVDENSILSGIVVNVYISSNSITTGETLVVGALANINRGVIFSCNAKELNTDVVRKLSPQSYGEITGSGTGNDAYKYETKDVFRDVYEGLIYATNNQYSVGGLVGQNDGLVSHSFAKVNVNANNAAGFVFTNNGTISNCYSTGTVSGDSSNVYAFVDNNSQGYCINSYTISPTSYTRQNTNQTIKVFGTNSINCWADKYATNGGDKETDSIAINFAENNTDKVSHGFASNVWKFNMDYNYGYPYFDFGKDFDYMKNSTTIIVKNSETEKIIYYQIPNIGKFNQISTSLSGKYKIIKDIDASLIKSVKIGTLSGIIEGEYFNINNLNINDYLFENNTGTVNNLTFGNTSASLNLTITEDAVNVGLFAGNLGTINNVNISSVVVTDKHSANLKTIGLICADNNNTGNVNNCKVGGVKTKRKAITINMSSGSLGNRNSLLFNRLPNISLVDVNTDGLYLDMVKTTELVVGGIVGKNKGTIKLCQMASPININPNLKNVKNHEKYDKNNNPYGVDSDNNKLQNVALGGIVGVNGNIVSFCGITSSCSLNAISVDIVNGFGDYGNRNVTTPSVAYVGGIAGLNILLTNANFPSINNVGTGRFNEYKNYAFELNIPAEGDGSISETRTGKISYCYTSTDGNHSLEDTLENNDASYEITAGNTITQTMSFVGGIAGYGGKVNYSYNSKNVGASARITRKYIGDFLKGLYEGKTAYYLKAPTQQIAYASGIANESECDNTINYAKIAGGHKYMPKTVAVITDPKNGEYSKYTWESNRDVIWNLEFIWNRNVVANGKLNLTALPNAGFEVLPNTSDAKENYLTKFYQIEDINYLSWENIWEAPNRPRALTKDQISEFGGVWSNLIKGRVEYTRKNAVKQFSNNSDEYNKLEKKIRSESSIESHLISTDQLSEGTNYTGTNENIYYYHVYNSDVISEQRLNFMSAGLTYDTGNSKYASIYGGECDENATKIADLYSGIVLSNDITLDQNIWKKSSNNLSNPYYDLTTEPSNENVADMYKELEDNATIEIGTEAQLRYIVDELNKGNDSDIINLSTRTIKLVNDIALDKSLTPINSFSGTFDGSYSGGSHSITNIQLNINNQDTDGTLAFIKNANNATINNITFGFSISSKNACSFGGIIGSATGKVSLDNVTVSSNNTFESNALNSYANFIEQVGIGADVTIKDSSLMSPTQDEISQNTKANIIENGTKPDNWKDAYNKNNSAIGGFVARNYGTLSIDNSKIDGYKLLADTSITSVGLAVGINSGTVKVSGFEINNTILSVKFNNDNFIQNENSNNYEYGSADVYVSPIVANNLGSVTLGNKIKLFNDTEETCIIIDATEPKINCNYSVLANTNISAENATISIAENTTISIGEEGAITQIGYGSPEQFEKIIVHKTNGTTTLTDNMRYNLFARSKVGVNLKGNAETQDASFDIKDLGGKEVEFVLIKDLLKNKFATSGYSKIDNGFINDYRFSANYFSTYNTIPRTHIDSEITVDGQKQQNYDFHTQYTFIQTVVNQIDDYTLVKEEGINGKEIYIPKLTKNSKGEHAYYSLYTDYIYVLDIYENNINYGEFGFTYTYKLKSVLNYVMHNSNKTQIPLNERSGENFVPKSGTGDYYEFNISEDSELEKHSDLTKYGITEYIGIKYISVKSTDELISYGTDKNSENNTSLPTINLKFVGQAKATVHSKDKNEDGSVYDKTETKIANVEDLSFKYNMPTIEITEDSTNKTISVQSDVYIEVTNYGKENGNYDNNNVIVASINDTITLLSLDMPMQLQLNQGEDIDHIKGLYQTNHNQTQTVHEIFDNEGNLRIREEQGVEDVKDDSEITPKSVTEGYNGSEFKKSANYYLVSSKYGVNDIISYIKYENGAYQVKEYIFSGNYYLGNISYNVTSDAILDVVKGERTVRFVPKVELSNLQMNLTYSSFMDNYTLDDIELITYKTVTTYITTVDSNGYAKYNDFEKIITTYKVTTCYSVSYSNGSFTIVELKENQPETEIEVSNNSPESNIVEFITKTKSDSKITFGELKICAGTESLSFEPKVDQNNAKVSLALIERNEQNNTEVRIPLIEENRHYIKTENDEELSLLDGDNKITFVIQVNNLLVQKVINGGSAPSYEDYKENAFYKLSYSNTAQTGE